MTLLAQASNNRMLVIRMSSSMEPCSEYENTFSIYYLNFPVILAKQCGCSHPVLDGKGDGIENIADATADDGQ